ncbi:MAG: DUF982 domain-containing protein [Alphaproteobacteria bacterium]|jgi:hypothetical protein|nr:DUF982 domain-containing protein [Alphaproteobacteria bacterium]MBU1548562.1 DUF982 domain-containing protein [Alphaproteobacteria bacterium]MBU2337758.1 DUF982 domain-containing protein [Alphaproteobacteria bacterium]MBU2389895.1 DUF982 domain-containing protein [Alphaproteobacteria bacterium]
MQTDIWDKPIEITYDGGDHFRSVCNPREALACLTNSWPASPGKLESAAKRACLKAMAGEVPLPVAEAAFTKAAEAAGVLRH